MAVKKVYVIYNNKQFKYGEILEDVKTECYPYDFMITDAENFDGGSMLDADEVWTFGNVENTTGHNYAVHYGKDIWKMA